MKSPSPSRSRVRLLAASVLGVCRRVLAAMVHVVRDGGGIDDAELPSGYAMPYQRGSRMVRNLWHLPF